MDINRHNVEAAAVGRHTKERAGWGTGCATSNHETIAALDNFLDLPLEIRHALLQPTDPLQEAFAILCLAGIVADTDPVIGEELGTIFGEVRRSSDIKQFCIKRKGEDLELS